MHPDSMHTKHTLVEVAEQGNYDGAVTLQVFLDMRRK